MASFTLSEKTNVASWPAPTTGAVNVGFATALLDRVTGVPVI